MKLSVLCSPTSWYLKDLQRASDAMGLRGATITPIAFRDLQARLGGVGEAASAGEQNNRPASGDGPWNADVVMVRTMTPASLEQVVFRMDVLARLEAAGVVVINPAKAIEVAVDKYLASARLEAAGLTVPRTIVCQTIDDALEAFHALGRDVVLKPLFGAEGRGLTRLTDEALAERAFRMLVPLGAVLYVQEFIEHEGHDVRVLVVGPDAWGMRRSHPTDWRINVSRGAKAEAIRLPPELEAMGRKAAEAVGAPVAGVDLLPAKDGRMVVLEVNAVPGWQAMSRATGVDIARHVLEFAASESDNRR